MRRASYHVILSGHRPRTVLIVSQNYDVLLFVTKPSFESQIELLKRGNQEKLTAKKLFDIARIVDTPLQLCTLSNVVDADLPQPARCQ